MLKISVTETDYFLPDDSIIAQSDFLELLHAPGDTYIDCYGLSLAPMVDEIISADTNHVKISINCDHFQSLGLSVRPVLRKIWLAFKTSGTGSSITITSAGDVLGNTTAIYHKKCMVVKALDGGEDYCAEGSVNFTTPAWFQANTLRIFRCAAWAQMAIQYHEENKAWALREHSEWQLTDATDVTVKPKLIEPITNVQQLTELLNAAKLLCDYAIITASDVSDVVSKLNIMAQSKCLPFVAENTYGEE